MKKFALLAASAAFALVACNGTEAPSGEEATSVDSGDASDILEGEAPGFEAVATGTYEVTRADGSVDYIEIFDGMTYSRIAADGAATGGTIFMQGGQTCFVVEGEEGQNCFTDGPKAEDGSMQTTSENGDVATVRPVEGGLADHVNDVVAAE
ncbi:MAG: hypothetical protein JY451_13435 [Erythrobacter sp.]|nr:MAG: hypothetical protein JY451_13435 [Erythrobacter sp.]